MPPRYGRSCSCSVDSCLCWRHDKEQLLSEQHLAVRPHLKRCDMLSGGPPPAASGAEGRWVFPLCNTKCGTPLMLLSHVESCTHMKILAHHFQRRQFDAIDPVAARLHAARVVAHEKRQDVSRFAAAIEGAVQAGRRPGEPDEELQARVARRTTGGGSTNGGRAAVGSGRWPSGEDVHGRGHRSWSGRLQTGAALQQAPAGGRVVQPTPVAASGGATTTSKPAAATEATVASRPAVAVTGEAAGRTTATSAVVTKAAVARRPAVLVMWEASGRTMRILLVPTAAVAADRPAVLGVHVEGADETRKSTDRAFTAEAVTYRLVALLTDAAAATGKTRGANP